MKTQSMTRIATEPIAAHARRQRPLGHGPSPLAMVPGLALCGLIALGILLTAGGSAAARGDGWVTDKTALDFLAAFNDTLARGEMGELAALFARDVQRRSPAGSQSGRAEVRAHYERMLKVFATLELEPRRIIADGYSAVCECRGKAQHKASGKRVVLPLAVTITFDAEGQVTSFNEYYDRADFRRQLK